MSCCGPRRSSTADSKDVGQDLRHCLQGDDRALKLHGQVDDQLARVERGQPFLPVIGGEAARIECCALAAKRCLGAPQAAALDPFAAAHEVGIVVHGPEYFARFTAAARRQVLELGGSHCQPDDPRRRQGDDHPQPHT
jgi:hypothetical protein